MAIIFMTGFEMGDGGWGDLVPGAVSSGGRGAWSDYKGFNGMAKWDSAVSTFYCGWAARAPASSNPGLTMDFRSPNGVSQLYVEDTPGAYTLRVTRGNGTVLATSSKTFQLNTWYYIELFAVIHDTTGQIQLRVDGQDWIALTSSLDTRNDSGTNGDKCDRVFVSPGHNRWEQDDVYVVDTSGSVNTSWLGDVRIKGYVGNAAGDNTGLTRGGTDSGSNYGQVDERPPNDATDYVYGTNTTAYDLYNLPNTANASGVKGAALWWKGQKDDASFVGIKPVMKVDTDASGTADTEYAGTYKPLSTTWKYDRQFYDQQPDGTNWSTAKLDALQIGVKSQ